AWHWLQDLADRRWQAPGPASGAREGKLGWHGAPGRCPGRGDVDQLAVDELAEAEVGQLAAEPGVLDAAERDLGSGPGRLVDEHHAAVDPPGHLAAPVGVPGEHRRAQPERGGVRQRDRLVFGLHRVEGRDGAEELEISGRVVPCDPGQDRRFQVIAWSVDLAAAQDDLRPAVARYLDLV